MRSRRFYSAENRPRRGGGQGPLLGATSLLTLGIILGLGGGLIYAWIIEPVVYVAASPARLSATHKEEYVALVSESYAADGDWEQALRRLQALGDPAPAELVADQLENWLRTGRPARDMGYLAQIARQLGVESEAVAFFDPAASPAATATAEPATPSATAPPTPSQTPRPTPTTTSTARPTDGPTPTPTALPVYRLLSQEPICRPDVPAPLIEVVVLSALQEEEPGVEVLVEWEGGADHFYTGFQPEKGAGFGDFTMAPGVSYGVTLAPGSPLVSGLRIETCAGSNLAGGWRLTFQGTQVAEPTVPAG